MVIKAGTYWGGKVWIRLPEYVSCRILACGHLDEETPFYLQAILRPGMTFFDIGAHYGFYSLLALEHLRETGRIVSFEPTPESFLMLRRNVGDAANVETMPCALSNQTGSAMMSARLSQASAFNRIQNGRDLPGDGSLITIATDTLDSFCAKRSYSPHVIKADVEGHEQQLLEGASRTIRLIKPGLIIETGMSNQPSRPMELLGKAGYRVFGAFGNKLRLIDAGEFQTLPVGFNVLCLHPEGPIPLPEPTQP